MQKELFKLMCSRIGDESDSGQAIKVYPLSAGGWMWIPMSQVEEVHRDPHEPYLMVTAWIAKEKGLI